jgi:hypothetical protein
MKRILIGLLIAVAAFLSGTVYKTLSTDPGGDTKKLVAFLAKYGDVEEIGEPYKATPTKLTAKVSGLQKIELHLSEKDKLGLVLIYSDKSRKLIEIKGGEDIDQVIKKILTATVQQVTIVEPDGMIVWNG